REFQVQAVGLFQDGQTFGKVPVPIIPDLFVIDRNVPPIGIDDSGDDPQKGALACRIASDQGDELPLGQLQVDPIHDQGVVVLFADVFYRYHTRFTLNNKYIKYSPPTKLMMMLTVEL